MLSFYVYTRALSELMCFYCYSVFIGFSTSFLVSQVSEKFSPEPQLIVCVLKITFEDLMKPSSICTLRVNPGGG